MPAHPCGGITRRSHTRRAVRGAPRSRRQGRHHAPTATRDDRPSFRIPRHIRHPGDRADAPQTDPAWVSLEYEHAKATLARDATVLDQLRTRASVVLSAMAIVASFVGTRTFDHAWLVGLSFGVIACGMISCMGVLWPARDRGPMPAPRESRSFREDWLPFDRGKRRFKSTLTVQNLREAHGATDTPPSAELVAINLLVAAHLINTRTLNRRTDLFQLACGLLVLEVVVLILLVLTQTATPVLA
jgi:hypothetical protein